MESWTDPNISALKLDNQSDSMCHHSNGVAPECETHKSAAETGFIYLAEELIRVSFIQFFQGRSRG